VPIVGALGKCPAHVESRQVKKNNAGDSNADTTLEEMADKNLSGVAQSVDNENGDGQPPTPHAPAKAADACR
jgi:hypothetical protein